MRSVWEFLYVFIRQELTKKEEKEESYLTTNYTLKLTVLLQCVVLNYRRNSNSMNGARDSTGGSLSLSCPIDKQWGPCINLLLPEWRGVGTGANL